jgi:hypothetical protein
MGNGRLKLPIGIQTFEELRTEGYIYVDKTKYLIEMIKTGKIYFLARPRRFGKSITVSTFDAIFSGKKELFKGLYAEEFLNGEDFKPSPVIWLDMSSVSTDRGIDALNNSIKQITLEVADKLKVELPEDLTEGDMLRKLIINTYNKYGQRVVILLDEYDKPYTDFVNDPVMAENVRKALRNFYVQIKANDRYIRFTFITGISKFTKLGVFSVLNTPLDISLSPKYAEICGYTEKEIKQYFPDYLKETARYMKMTAKTFIERMRTYYNGFSFDSQAKTRLYNPYSALSFFADKEWNNYWIESGKSKVIAEYMKNRHLTVEQFRDFPISRDFARSPGDMDSTPPHGFLYQGGYLTLRKKTGDSELCLDYPNTEVLNSMSQLLTQNIVSENAYNNYRTALLTALDNKNTGNLIHVFNRLLASIPYDDYTKAFNQIFVFNSFKFPVQEWLYRSTILSFLRGCGVDVAPEIHTNMGRSDLVIAHKGGTWVIENKVAYKSDKLTTKTAQALQQMETKNYAKPYADAVSIVLVIDDETRQITG